MNDVSSDHVALSATATGASLIQESVILIVPVFEVASAPSRTL